MGLAGYRIPVSVIKLLVLSCMCSLAVADARADDELPARTADWSVRTEFGGFDISVDADFTQITRLAVHLAGYSCGGVCVTGDIRADSRGAWPMEDNRFQARTSLGIYDVILSGTIDRARKSACGTWSVRAAGTACSGTWKTD